MSVRCFADAVPSQTTRTSRSIRAASRSGMNLLEIVAVTTLLGVVATIAVVRLAGGGTTAKKNACYLTKGNIEAQVQLWYRNKGTMPASNLADIGANVAYFPAGLPTCPVDNSAYTIDASTGRVVGHTH